MDWSLAALIIVGGLLILMLLGIPIAISFLLINLLGIMIWWGGEPGLRQLILSTRESVSRFLLLPIPLFILMGEVMFRSGVAQLSMITLDKWIGRVSGRLSLLAVAGGTVFATLSGSGMASAVLLGKLLLPEMEKRGYKKPMSLGPILGSSGLAMMIPPSAIAILVGAVAEVSIAKILIAIIIPGLLMATLYAAYIIIRCRLQPRLAPPYVVSRPPMSERLIDTARYILPLGLVIFLVLGIILLGVATPSEAAASGTLGTFILAAAYRRLHWRMVKESVLDTTKISIVLLFIIATSTTYSQILATSGASQGFIELALALPLPPIGIIIAIMAVLIFMGMFLNLIAMILIAIPILMPVVSALGYDPIWFLVLFMINGEMSGTTPPFGVYLFALQGVAPAGTTFGDCVRASFPFVVCDSIAMIFIFVFPALTLWLPGLM